jgi:PTS system mannitol-specific IIA component
MSVAIISEDKVRLGVACATKWEAIEKAGELLVAAGHVTSGYPALMSERERIGTTYVGNGVAIPHGTREAMASVQSPGISVLQIPAGVDFGDGQICRLVLGLAARDGSHLDLLTQIAIICADDASIDRMLRATSARALVSILAPNF